MKRKILSLALTLALSAGLAAPTLAAYDNPSFTDVPKDFWGYTYIEQAAEKGWISGMGGGKFQPNDQVTYAQFCVMLVQAFFPEHLAAYTGPSSPWYVPYCSVASRIGLLDETAIAKIPTDTTKANQPCSRQEMALIVYNAMRYTGAVKPSDTALVEAAMNTADYPSYLPPYSKAISTAKAMGVINGVDSKGTFSGRTNMNRAQAAVVMVKLDKAMNRADGNRYGQYDTSKFNVPADTNKDGFLTEAEVTAVLEQIEKEYPGGTKWGLEEGACAAYAQMVGDRIFGDLQERTISTMANIRPGDLIYTHRYNDPGHVAVVLDTSEDNRYCSVTEGNVSGKVWWGSHYYYAETERYLNQRATAEHVTFSLRTRYPDANYHNGDRVFEMVDLYPEIRCANCGYLMRKAGSNDFDENGDAYEVCDICHDYFVCGQCLDCPAFLNHIAYCKG